MSLSELIELPHEKTCGCKPGSLSCLDPKEWLKAQVGIWRFAYEKRDVRDKNKHPATFPIQLARRVIDLFTHQGELVLDPFSGSGTTLVAACDAGRSVIGIDLKPEYADLAVSRLPEKDSDNVAVVVDDAALASKYVAPGTVKLVLTSPPYADVLNRPRTNKSRHGKQRDNGQLGKIEQYSQDERDLGTYGVYYWSLALEKVYKDLRPLLTPDAHVVMVIAECWKDGGRVAYPMHVVAAMTRAGYEHRNTIIWDKTNLVNGMGIFGYPKTYITAGVTYEHILDFIIPRRNDATDDGD